MIVYLASPSNQVQADHAAGMPVLLSFACFGEWLHGGYQQSFSRILIDSGAYSELNSGKVIDLERYRDWSQQWRGHADAIAGLDDIRGDWRRSLANYARIDWSFPTWHDSDPIELLSDFVPMARERGGWIGIGMVPPRQGKERVIREALERIPEGIHVHGWALRQYTHIRRLDSVDSTNWWRDAMKLRTLTALRHLTFGECLEIVVKRYQRWTRTVRDKPQVASLLDGQDVTAACPTETLTS